MSTDQSLISFFFDAGPVVKTVMLLLLVASVISWTFIFQRALFLKQVFRAIDEFEDKFWAGSDVEQLYQQSKLKNESKLLGIQAIFHAGYKEYLKLNEQINIAPDTVLSGSQRAMRIAYAHEMDKLEQHLSFLATIGSTSPYIGLFGTVWGIMTSFRALGTVQQATIAMVAPGISEALIATAIGLFAAIPAVVAYNHYSNQVERLANQYESFQEELSNVFNRQLYGDAA